LISVAANIVQEKKRIKLNERELVDREDTLNEKRERILSLKKKIQELEKFKFVLDYKIKELKRDIGPREIEI
jgi:cilia- and flagella-associated protein 57